MKEWKGEERRAGVSLSDDQINDIARKAAKEALELVYAEVGRSAIRLFLWVAGAGVIALLAWLGATGRLK